MILLLDLGNSRVKWATWADGRYGNLGATPVSGNDLSQRLGAQLRPLAAPQRIVAANVSGVNTLAAAQDAAMTLWKLPVDELRTQEQQCGVTNAYNEPGQLGVDRWLAMLAAWNRFRRSVCVVDLGTAVTIDIVAADGRHRGGLIAPGLATAHAALLERTAGIGAQGDSHGVGLGRSTAECVGNGCLLAVIGLVRAALEMMESECGAGGVLVAGGGDAPRVLPHLGIAHEHVPTLVFDGMLLAGGHG